jgi:hypothetical protein
MNLPAIKSYESYEIRLNRIKIIGLCRRFFELVNGRS